MNLKKKGISCFMRQTEWHHGTKVLLDTNTIGQEAMGQEFYGTKMLLDNSTIEQ